MFWIDRKEKELKKMWQEAQFADGLYKELLMEKFWKEYRILRKSKKFQREIVNSNEAQSKEAS